MATFSREINTAPSLGACVMAWFQEGAVFIWFLAGRWADVSCDPGSAQAGAGGSLGAVAACAVPALGLCQQHRTALTVTRWAGEQIPASKENLEALFLEVCV